MIYFLKDTMMDVDVIMVGKYILFMMFAWQVCNFIEWCLHLIGHVRIPIFPFSEIHRVHMVHHKIHYPFNKLLSNGKYIDGGGAMAFGPIVLILLFLFYCIIPSYDLYCIFVLEAFILVGSNTYLHSQFHIKGSWLEKYKWFIHRRYLHFYHHGHLRNNMSLGGIDPTIDKLMKTYHEIHVPVKEENFHKVPKRKKV
jgi:hypothetical protein